MIDNKKLKTTLTTNFQLPKQVNQAKEEAFAKIKASKVSEAAKTEVSSKSRVFLQTNDTNITMPSMDGWSRKEAEAFARKLNISVMDYLTIS